ncbi:MAG: LamG-like jellyroll fold domain-containing protein [Planctomycetota bacterium]|jgi:hypothetical protein
MVKKMMFLMVILLAAGSAQANILTNGDFELGVGGYMSAGGYAPDGWTMIAGAGSWHQSAPPEVVQGTQSVVMWGADTLGQDFTVTPGAVYEYSVDAINSAAGGSHTISPVGMSLVLYAESLGAGAAVIETVEVDRFECGVDPDETWTTISGSYTAAGGAVTGGIRIVFEGANSTTHMSFDNAVVTEAASLATDPWPENGSPQVPSVVNAAGNLEFTLPDDPAITSMTYDLYWQVDDTNDLFWTNEGSGSSTTLGERIFVALPETITAGHTYYWKVDLNITTTEPNFYPGPVWSFTTTNAPPVVDAGGPISQNVWLSGGSAVVSLDGVVTDDGLPTPPGAVTTLWSSSPATGVSFVDASNPVTDVTFTAAGDYYLTLAANDSEFEISDIIQVRVLADGYDGLVALYEFEGTANDTAPIGGNHHGTLDTLDEADPNLPVIDSLDSKVGLGSLLIGGIGQRVYVSDSGIAEPNATTGVGYQPGDATWADMQTTDQVTVSTWLKVAPGLFGNAYASLLSKSSAYGLYRYDVYGTALSVVGDWGGSNAGQIAALDTGIGPILDDGRWHHIAETYDGVALRYYVDGLLEGEIYDDTYLNAMPIGGGYLEWGYGMTGRFDQVRIHDVALSADMILAQYLADGGGANCRQQYWALPTDLDFDCDTDLADFAIMAGAWLDCTDLLDPGCTADDGLIPPGP